MTELKIKNFSQLISGYIDSRKKIKSYELKKLPQFGYGSVMIQVVVTLEDEKGSTEKMYTIAKLLPSTQFVRKIFQIKSTYKKEIAFYKTIIPTLLNFQKEHGISTPLDIFAEFYGARLSLDTDEVDDDAVLVLKDLSVEGFKNHNRHEGLDLPCVQRILKDLARLQGTAIAIKLKNPKLFQEKIKVFCKDFVFNEAISFHDNIKIILKENEACAPLVDKISHWPCKIPEPREPYATIAHTDLWVNNTMQKIVNEKIEANVFVDFQGYSYRSCASDVFFFLWTSCRIDVLENCLDDLLKHYHDNLIATIKEFNCDITQFTHDKFLDDIKYEFDYEFGHTLRFVVTVKYKSLLEEENLKNNVSKEEYMAKVPQRVKEFLYFMVQECHKRGWLN